MLVRSVSGVRGIVGDGLSPVLVRRFAEAFAEGRGGTVAVAQDGRSSGLWLAQAALTGLKAAGASPVYVGLCATPAAQVCVEELAAAGGIVITASHNPDGWNGLKFVGPDGTFLAPEEMEALFAAVDARTAAASQGADFEADVASAIPWDPRAVTWHVMRACRGVGLEAGTLARAKLRIVVDGCRSVGGLSTMRALRHVGCEVVELDCEPDGRFTRGLEPLPENLGALGARVRDTRAHFGVAHDPDGDRAALVDEHGDAVGEERTLALAVAEELERRPGPVVVNLSTSSASGDLAKRAGVPFHRAPVGERHVVGKMREVGAKIGGEGNGGVILPAAHWGRDGTVAALIAARAAAAGSREPFSARLARLPRYEMVKSKFEGVDWKRSKEPVRAAFADAEADGTDGWRFAWPEEWIHVRPSGTEPVVRVIAEARTAERARALCDRARKALS
jgi:phosphomannomutase